MTQVANARMLDLPMTQALTINWEQICGTKDLCKSLQSGFLRRLQRLAKHLRFELAYIWVNATGKNAGLHAHMMIYWPQRYIRSLMRALQKLTSDPNVIHIQSIDLIDRKDNFWGQYLADHIIKHSHYSRSRNFGYSRNLLIQVFLKPKRKIIQNLSLKSHQHLSLMHPRRLDKIEYHQIVHHRFQCPQKRYSKQHPIRPHLPIRFCRYRE